MELTRQILLKRIQAYLKGSVTKDQLYQWALAAAVSDEYEDFKNKDVLITQTVQVLIDINKGDKNPEEFNKKLVYHQKCLAGEDDYVPRKIEAPAQTKETPADFFVIIRIYIIIFAASSILLNFFSLLNPNFLQFGEGSASFANAVKDALPHLIYAAVILMPLKVSAKGLLFFPVFLVLCLGMLFYWYIPISLVNKFTLNPVSILIVLPFSAMPATLALLQFMVTKDKLTKKQPT